ncbi:hypothetical protein G6F22_017373 [Rhizopus arrhizus]|nr:hypothetical protein G6F22_017373 [Rhizopus arrhizus]KAG1244063.1 hypothetical protein G6F65_022018 [Rhizopus arrhizus]
MAAYRIPAVRAFKVAATRVEHSSLRNTLSTWVRTVLGLIFNARAASLLLAPRLIWRKTSSSRCDSVLVVRRAAGAPPDAAVMAAAATSASKRPASASSRRMRAASCRE